MASTNTSKKQPTKYHQNFLEQLQDTSKNEMKALGSAMVQNLTGISPRSPQGGGDFASAEQRPAMPNMMSPERMNYPPFQRRQRSQEFIFFSYRERDDNLQVNEEIKKLVSFIRREVSLLEQDNKLFLQEAAKLSVEQLPEKPGIYHVRFLEWVLKMLRELRKKVAESRTWFAAVQGKRQKMGFWGKVKKHGTSFMLSGERTASTQSG